MVPYRLKNLFERDSRKQQEIAANKTKIEITGKEIYVLAVVDCDTLKVLHVDVSSGRLSLDALLFLKVVLKGYRIGPNPQLTAARGTIDRWDYSVVSTSEKRGEIDH